MQSLKLFRQLIARQASRRNYSGGHHEMTTLNDLPSPNGSWKLHYEANQRRYNGQLFVGIATLLGTIAFGKSAGLLEVYNDIPERPADIESYK